MKADGTEYFAKVKNVLQKFIAKLKVLFSNITNKKGKPYTTLRKMTAICKELIWPS